MRRLLVPILVVVALLAGVTLGGHPELLPGFARDVFVGDQETKVVAEAIDEIHASYYRRVPKGDLADAAIAGAVRSLDDRFSNYLDKEAYDRFKSAGHQRYEGVGMEVVAVARGLRVVNTYDGSPARRAGIRPGDIIAAVNGKSIAGKAARTGSDRIKGPPGTEVQLTVLRGERRRVLTVSRARVTVPVVASRIRRTAGGEKVGVVRLATFTSGAHGELGKALRKLRDAGARGFVLDLRGNGGGLVTEAQLVTSAFLEDGVVVSTKGRAVRSQTLRTEGEALIPKAPLVVLVDRNSASASEIVAGALQDQDRATVAGTKTFGKGVFQQIIDLSNGGALDITAGQYFTPDGRNLGGRGVKTGSGIKPDVVAKDRRKTRRDEALDRALAVLADKLP